MMEARGRAKEEKHSLNCCLTWLAKHNLVYDKRTQEKKKKKHVLKDRNCILVTVEKEALNPKL